MKNYILILFLFFSINTLIGQNSSIKVSKFNIGIETHIGVTFPNFITQQQRWKARIYSGWGVTLSALARFNQHWSGDIGVGLYGYNMINKSSFDRYNLDFFSPHLIMSLYYNKLIRKNTEMFFGLSIGGQKGYDDFFIDQFDDYQVIAESKNLYYYFSRISLGKRKILKKRSKRIPPLTLEYGSFFKYNFNSLGTATFLHNDNYSEVVKPKGHVLGVYLKFLIPSSTTTVKLKNKKLRKPPIIYNPRLASN